MTEPWITQTITVRIPGRPPTLNSRRHWRVVAEDNEQWKGDSTLLATQARNDWESRHGLTWRPIRHAQLEVIFGLHTKAHRDWDNLISTIKPLLDGIVASKLLIDDTIDVIVSIRFAVTYSKGDPYTEFVITEDAK